jgi:purine-nucleoside/S-methyl-5'-thioadenosine phosphorylase / adenosine deaminase
VRWEGAQGLGVEVAVTTRHGGVSPPPYDTLNLGLHVGDDDDNVVTNRRRATAAFGTDLSSVVFARQVHGVRVARVEAADAGRGTLCEADAVEGADTLVTTAHGVTLAILVADCLPLALIDPDAAVLATVHAGWRGTAGGVVGHALASMATLGARADRVHAYIGPAVSARRYQVDEVVRAALADAVRPHPLADGVATPDEPGHWLVDLVGANRQHLELAGVAGERVTWCGTTTADDSFFSDRAQRPCGRFALLARLAG